MISHRSEIYTPKIAVFSALFNEADEILLLRRRGTPWLEGYYDLPAGHVEIGETLYEGAIRETLEETGIELRAGDLDLVHIYQNDNHPQNPYIGFVFQALRWHGIPDIREPAKCSHMDFFKPNSLPSPTTPYTIAALGQIANGGIGYSYYGPGEITG